MAMTFAKPQFMSFGGNRVTDHNRSEVSIEVERIETQNRMANGTLRKYVVADKRRFSTDWSNVPSKARFTVDGYWGVEEIEKYYQSNPDDFTLYLNYSDGRTDEFRVVLSSFSKTLVKRGAYDMYNMSVEMEEV